MKSKEIRKIINKAEKDVIKEIKRLYPLVSVHHYDTELEYIIIDSIISEYYPCMTIHGINKVNNNKIDIIAEDGWGSTKYNVAIEDLTSGDKLYILEQLELLAKPLKKKKILKLQ